MPENIYREQLTQPSDRVITALDNMSWEDATAQVQEIGKYIGMAKTNSLHQRLGSDFAVETLAKNGLFTMLDGKYHDIPETVEAHVREVTQSGAALITVHASGGAKMLEAAIRGRDEGRRNTVDFFEIEAINRIGGILGITVLTSLKEECYSIFGIPDEDKDGIKKKVIQFAYRACEEGLDGIVCSALELEAIRANSNFDNLLTVVPGITPSFAVKAKDQARTASVKEAFSSGADMIVVGRAINNASNYSMSKAEAAIAIVDEVKEGLGI